MELNAQSTESIEQGGETRWQTAENKEHGANRRPGRKNGRTQGKSIIHQPDLRPEFCQYADEGCALAKSCLNCPFGECIYDAWGGKLGLVKEARAKEMARLHIVERKKVRELAQMFGVSRRTVERAIRRIEQRA